jgi:CheY-like chemotaxis protein
MIVDDDDSILQLMREIIERLIDVEIVCFSSPIEALEAFEAEPETFEFVITDFEMHGLNGVELSSRLRALQPTLKILLATGSELFSNEEALEKGFCGLLRKPFPFAALQKALAPAILEYSQNAFNPDVGIILARPN